MHSHVPRTPDSLALPGVNRGVGFTHEERRRLHLVGRLPPGVLTLEQQAERVWLQLQGQPTDLARNVLLEQLHYRHEILYFKVLSDHLCDLLPVVYTPTVGEAIQQFSEEYRGQRGIYLSINDPEAIAESFGTLQLGPDDVDLIVCTDGEAILGIGDWGVGGIEISVGKLALYTAGGGIDPRRTIAVALDVGTDNEHLLADPFYVGNRHARSRGNDYHAFIRRYIETSHRLFPRAMLHFEDFGPGNARAILDEYGADYCVFNDDVQGTGAVVLAALYAGLRITKIPMRDQKVVVFGAGTAGIGVADQIRDAMIAAGVSAATATSQIWTVDRQGLLFDNMDDLRDFQRPYAKSRGQLAVMSGQRIDLLATIEMATPTILLGCSGVPGAFTRDVINAMTASTPQPLIFPLSNPTSRMEASAHDILNWSGGKALIATGSPQAPTEHEGEQFRISQANNALVFPGIGLGVILAGAQRITKGMLHAAAKALAHQADTTKTDGTVLPDIERLSSISTVVAQAVYHAAVEEGVATKKHTDIGRALVAAQWHPQYHEQFCGNT